jgi:hypothetical protein
MRRILLLASLAAILSLPACGKSEPPANPGEGFRKFQEEMYQAKVKAGKTAFEARKFDAAMVALDEAQRFGPLDAAAAEVLAKAKEGKHAELVSDGHKAMKTGDYEAARKAFSSALAIALDDDVRGWRDEAIARAWKQAGAEVGWMRVTGQGVTFSLEQQPEGFVPPKNQAYEYRRSFKFRSWKPGMLSTLPPPEESYGLDLSNTSFDDAAVDELARLKGIYILNVQFTKLTNEGRDRLRKTVFVQWMTL